MMTPETDTPIEYVFYSWKELKKSRSPGRSLLEESQKRPGLGERDSSKSYAHHEKIPHTEMLDCIVFSSFDVRVIR